MQSIKRASDMSPFPLLPRGMEPVCRCFRGERTRAIGGLGLKRVHSEGQGLLQGPRRGFQNRYGQCQ